MNCKPEIMTGHNDEKIDQYYEFKKSQLLLSATEAQLILDDQYHLWQPHLVYPKDKNTYHTIWRSHAGKSGAERRTSPQEDPPRMHYQTVTLSQGFQIPLFALE